LIRLNLSPHRAQILGDLCVRRVMALSLRTDTATAT